MYFGGTKNVIYVCKTCLLYLFLVDLDDPLSVCELPKYPATRGPVTMAFTDIQDGFVVACGEHGTMNATEDGEFFGSQECFIFDGITWDFFLPLPHTPLEPVTPLECTDDVDICILSPVAAYSYFMQDIGLWVGSANPYLNFNNGNFSLPMVNELFGSEGQWKTLPVDFPSEYGYYNPCIVPLNSTHLFFSGGGFAISIITWVATNDTWILDLENLEWTSSTPMLSPRGFHGCLMTPDGEVIVAGGGGGDGYVILSSVHTFNPVSLEWRESGDLPSEVETPLYPSLLTINDKVILMDYGAEFVDGPGHVWEREEDQGWRLLDVSMGASFQDDFDNAVAVPGSWRKGCA